MADAVSPGLDYDPDKWDVNLATGEVTAKAPLATAPEGGVLSLPAPPVTEPTETIEGIGEAYEGVTPGEVPTDYAGVDVAGVTTEFRPGEEYVSPSATVSGQLESLLSRDSKYIEMARRRSAEEAQERGLLSTSMAAGAGEAAAIEAALPIAQQDAKAYQEALQRQQASEYEFISDVAKTELSGRLTVQQSTIQMQNQIVQNSFDTAIAQAGDESKVWFQDAQNQYNTAMRGFETQLTGIINEQAFSAASKENLLNSSGSVMQNYQISVENLLTNPDVLALLKTADGPEAVNAMIATQQTLASNTIMFMGSAVGVDMSSYVDEFLQPAELATDVQY